MSLDHFYGACSVLAEHQPADAVSTSFAVLASGWQAESSAFQGLIFINPANYMEFLYNFILGIYRLFYKYFIFSYKDKRYLQDFQLFTHFLIPYRVTIVKNIKDGCQPKQSQFIYRCFLWFYMQRIKDLRTTHKI